MSVGGTVNTHNKLTNNRKMTMNKYNTRKNINVNIDDYYYFDTLGREFVEHNRYYAKQFQSWLDRYNPDSRGTSSSNHEYQSIVEDMKLAKMEQLILWEAKYPELDINDYQDDSIVWKFKCEGCGSWSTYGVEFKHLETDESIRIGSDCAEQFRLGNERISDIERLRTQFSANQKQARNVANVRKFITRTSQETFDNVMRFAGKNRILRDFSEKIQWFELTDKQIAFIHTLIKQELDKEAEITNKLNNGVEPLVEGRHTFEGEIAKLYYKSDWDMWKVIIKTDDYTFSANRTEAMKDMQEGDKFVFNATIVPSKDDQFFGYAKRIFVKEIINGK